MNAPKLLVAEDNTDIQQIISSTLDKYNLTLVESPDEAIKKIENKEEFDGMICDYHFDNSVSNGHDIYLKYRQLNPNKPFVLFSSDSTRVRQKFISEFDFIIEKTFGFQKLLRFLDAYFKKDYGQDRP